MPVIRFCWPVVPAVWKSCSRRLPLLSAVGLLLLAFCLAGAGVQEKKSGTSGAGDKKGEIPPAEEITLSTDDGVDLQATFYPGTKKRESVPIILLHMFKGSRADYKDLAPYLQTLGHAVLVPDLRGHGGSIHVKNATRNLDAATMPTEQFARTVTSDMETLKAFLMRKNNAGELNIEKLCVVGAEMGAGVALDWARLDWSWPPLATGKQGQDVKALVLISPEWSVRGLQLKQAMGHPDVRSKISVYVLVGKDKPKSLHEAEQMYSMFKRSHPEPPKNEEAEKKDLFFDRLQTSLQGTKMLGVKGLNVEKGIERFIDRRLVSKPFPWRDRSLGKVTH